VGPDTLTSQQQATLDTDGYLVLPGLVGPELLGALRRVIVVELARADRDPLWRPGGTVHLDSVLDAGAAIDTVWTAPRLLAAVAHLLGPDFRIRRMHFRAPQTGHGAQALHTDTRPGPPPTDGAHEATAIVALVDVDAAGGATRVIPGSHRRHDVAAPTQPDLPHPEQHPVPLTAGSALVFSGHLWHSGTRNERPPRRDALQLSFSRRSDQPHPNYPDVSTATFDRLGPAAMLLL